MPFIADVAGDWKCVSSDRLVPVSVREVDPDTGPADDDERTEDVPALQWLEDEPLVALPGGGEVGAATCSFEFAVADVGFDVRRRCRVTDPAGRVWVLDTVATDSTNSVYRCVATETRCDR